MALPAFVAHLMDPAAHRPPVAHVRLIETHISWVIIAGPYAYKIKKPVRFDFVDFSTPEQRHHFCLEELRLNRRFAPQIYLDVIDIGQQEWAVKMRAFPAQATLDRQPSISAAQIDAIADAIWAFQHQEPPLAQASDAGTPQQVSALITDNMLALEQRMKGRLAPGLRHWVSASLKTLGPVMAERKRQGFIRDGHGDLHLGNIAWDNDGPIIFDCIEFSPLLRQNDLISDIAFLAMDLHARNEAPMAWRLLNRWLEHSGDIAGLQVLRLYMVHRALVRAKISLLQDRPEDRDRYLGLAERLTIDPPVFLGLMHGYSGSGKTFWSGQILAHHGAIRLRSDIERKRLAGIHGLAQSHSGLGQDLYGAAMTAATFDAIAQNTARLLAWHFPVIVDATFLQSALRAQFIALGRQAQVPVHIIDVQATPQECLARIAARADAVAADASEATPEVLHAQLAAAQPLSADERAYALTPQQAITLKITAQRPGP